MSPDKVDTLDVSTSGLSERLRLTLAAPMHGCPEGMRVQIVREGSRLWLEFQGDGDGQWIRDLMPSGTAGSLVRQQTLELSTYEWGPVELNATGAHSVPCQWGPGDHSSFNARIALRSARSVRPEPSAVRRALGLTVFSPRANGPLLWPDNSSYRAETTTQITRSGINAARSTSGGEHVLDHLSLDLRPHFSCAVNLGELGTDRSTSLTNPGFLEFAGDGVPELDHDLVHGLVRGIGLIFGVGLSLAAWYEHDEDGVLTGWTIRDFYSPDIHGGTEAWPVSRLARDARTHQLDAGKVSHALSTYLSRRAELNLDRVAWLAMHGRRGPLDRMGASLRAAIEILVDSSVERRVGRRILARDDRRALLGALKPVLDDWCSEREVGSAERERLAANLERINSAPNNARLRAMFEAADIEFGPVEKLAWDAANECAHASERVLTARSELLFSIRALQAVFGRCVTAATGLADNYIDYSTETFPSRHISINVGGPSGSEANVIRQGIEREATTPDRETPSSSRGEP